MADEIVASSMTLLRRVWRDQRCNQNPYIKEQTSQLRKEKVQKEKQWSTKHMYKAKGRVTGDHIRVVPSSNKVYSSFRGFYMAKVTAHARKIPVFL